jgi:aspartate kinase
VTGESVHKFGGAALRDGPAVRRAGEVLAACGGPRPLVVVSAHEGVTRLLGRVAEEAARGRVDAGPVRLRHRSLLAQLDLPSELLNHLLAELQTVLAHLGRERRLDRRRRDFVLSFGERMSARVVAAHLRATGVPATPVDAFDLGLESEARAGMTLPRDEGRARVSAAVRAVPGVPVVTGFLAQDGEGHVTTLGRNGSDLTAVWLGAALGAGEVHLWKAVDAICSADPKVVPGARTLARLSYLAAADLALHGADVLHPAAMEPARRAGVVVRVRSIADPDAPGTTIAGGAEPDPLALAHRRRVALLSAPAAGGAAGPALAALESASQAAGLEPFLRGASEAEAWLLLPDPEPGEEHPLEPRGAGPALERGLASLALVGPPEALDALAAEALELARRAGLSLRHLPAGLARSRLLLAPHAGLDRALELLHTALILTGAPTRL